MVENAIDYEGAIVGWQSAFPALVFAYEQRKCVTGVSRICHASPVPFAPTQSYIFAHKWETFSSRYRKS